MKNIEYRELGAADIETVRGMCESLMKFQAEKAKVQQAVLANMNFENRFIPDYKAALRKSVIVAYVEGVPAGFSFTTVTDITELNVKERPGWATGLDGNGFYPEDYVVPKRIGTFKLLYVDSDYRGLDIGSNLSERSMSWLKSNNDIEDLWVFVANGNEQVGKFYEKYGFKLSHSVFNGFIYAYYQSAGAG